MKKTAPRMILILSLVMASAAGFAADKKKFKRHRLRGPSVASVTSCKEKQSSEECSFTGPNLANIQGKCQVPEGATVGYCLPNGLAPYSARAPMPVMPAESAAVTDSGVAQSAPTAATGNPAAEETSPASATENKSGFRPVGN